jgi:hypothetical protein
LHDLVAKYGPQAVNRAGIETMEFPGILCLEENEVRQIRDFLERGQP